MKGVLDMNGNMTKLYQSIESEKQRSAWDKGVTEYALELVEQLAEQIDGGYFDELELGNTKVVKIALLNGAKDWNQYSWGGCSLIYDCDIAKRLCCPSELRKTHNGERRPNSKEEWLDTQARALTQAANRVNGYTIHRLKMLNMTICKFQICFGGYVAGNFSQCLI